MQSNFKWLKDLKTIYKTKNKEIESNFKVIEEKYLKFKDNYDECISKTYQIGYFHFYYQSKINKLTLQQTLGINRNVISEAIKDLKNYQLNSPTSRKDDFNYVCNLFSFSNDLKKYYE